GDCLRKEGSMRLGRWVIACACILAFTPFLFMAPQTKAAELTDEEVTEFRALLEERKVAEEALSDGEVAALRGFLDQFKDITFGGFVENFYQWESVDPISGDGVAITPKVFDRQENSFTVNNIEMWLYKEAPNPGDVGFKITLNWGDTARRITFVGPVHDESSTKDQETFSEGFVLWNIPIGKGLTMKFGKFATWVGWEVWEAHWNANFSRSYIYGWGIPFTNTGVGFSYPVTDRFTADYYFVNTSDTFVNNNETFTHGVQLDYNPPDIASFLKDMNLHLDILYGVEAGGAAAGDQSANRQEEEWRQRYDFTVSFSPFDKWGYVANANWSGSAENGDRQKTSETFGIAQYVTYQHTDRLGFALRGEYFWDHDGWAGATGHANGASAMEITGTVNLLLREKLWIRPEIRYDAIVSARGDDDAWDDNTSHDENITFAIATTYEW
ncbi:MAG: outer membrane beta-barrel protein, partial [Candidatus Brocadiales bacterium]